MLTFWPMMHRSPMRASFMTWEKCQTLVPAPIVGALVDDGRLVNEVRPGRGRAGGGEDGEVERRPPGQQRALAGVEHAQDAQPLRPVGQRGPARPHALEEVLALGGAAARAIDLHELVAPR